MLNLNFSEKSVGRVSPPYFDYNFFKKNVSHVVFYYLTKFHCLIVFTSLEHKFKHSFQDCINLLYFWGNETETSTHYLLHCPTYANERMALLNKIRSINCSIMENLVMLLWQKFYYLVIILLVILLIPSFWTHQLNTSYLLKDLKAPF